MREISHIYYMRGGGGGETAFLFQMRESPAKCGRLDRSANTLANKSKLIPLGKHVERS